MYPPLCDSADCRGSDAGRVRVSSSLRSPPPLPPSSCASSTSTSKILATDVFNFLWIHLLINLSKNVARARAQSLLLPGEPNLEQQRLSRCPFPDPALNYRPVIGILSHPGDGASGRLNNASNASYIAASYVKFVEAAGARVIPLIYNEPEEVLLEKLNLVNGVLFTGGWAKTGLYYDMVERIFKYYPKTNMLATWVRDGYVWCVEVAMRHSYLLLYSS
ncbi:Gamma-glutamyl hydrolase 2 [Nymphaea thermarum]|nr:Gamma-glutamyl hydrolase 2 [Nymphaea thermarum]